ncbi:MAG: NAD(P)/FAD-dependent oxidoreductase [Bacteroidales bacterium]|jgi:NADH dehydrogenase
METSRNKIPELVIIGGGFAGITLIKMLKNKPVNITLFDKYNFHTFQPLLYQVATGGLDTNSIAFPFRKMFRKYNNFHFRMEEINKIDTSNNLVITQSGNYRYDLLVIATGAEPNYFGNHNISENSIPLKNINDALSLRSAILKVFENALLRINVAEKKVLLNFVIVGGGPTGVEIAGALAEFKKHILPKEYPELDPNFMNIHLIEAGKRVLESMSENASNKALLYLKNMGVLVRLNSSVKDFDGVKIQLNNSEILEAATLIWTAGVRGSLIQGVNNVSVIGNRYIVDEFNLIKGYNNIYALGDIARMITDDYPKGHPMIAPVAIQQAKILACNLFTESKKLQPVKFHYHHKGSMATIGRNKAVADVLSFKFHGVFAWFAWMFLHLLGLIGYKNKFFVLIDWTWSYFTYEKSFQLIINPLIKDTCKICDKK